MNKHWYKNAVIYCLDIESFLDTNDDGIGDFSGLRQQLNYISSLGANCIWILPFYDTPNKDNGYDVRDYYQVDKRLGDLGHFAELLDTAEEYGIRVIIDLVANHTSDEHFWFREARKDKKSPYRDYYIWSEKKPKDDGEHAIFGEHQGHSNWRYDRKAKAYYYHTFYPHQPDLNVANPQVQREIMRVMHFWLKLGVSGFRIDAAPHMVRKKGTEKFKGDPHDIFRKFRELVEEQKKDAILLAEVDVDPKKYKNFFGDGDQMHMLFNFYINNYLFLSFARGEATPLIKALNNLPNNPKNAQMANFLRNHDELDLERLTDKEREEVYKAFAPDENMRIFDRGIRRRLASMLGNDRKRIELAYSLLLSLPGTPVIRYGQEIGMGEDLSLEGRSSVRTVMQWTNEKNGGFSTVPTNKLIRPTIPKGPYSYKNVNVIDQQRDPSSLFNWMDRAVNSRKESPEFGWGECEIIEANNPKVMVHSCKSNGGLAVAIHNFSDEEQSVKLKTKLPEGMMEVFADKTYDKFNSKIKEITVSPYGYRWLRKIKIQEQ